MSYTGIDENATVESEKLYQRGCILIPPSNQF